MPETAAPAPRRKSRKKLIIIIGLSVAVLLTVGAVMKGKNSKPLQKVTTAKAAVRTITEIVTATGKVQPEVEVRISPEVSGELIDIPVKEGQVIKKGDLLVKIKPDFYQAQLEQQEAGLASARASALLSKARLAKAEQDFAQAVQLYAKQLISDAEHLASKTNLDVASADYAAALANIRRTEGQVSQVRDQVSKATIYAPNDGTISSLTSEVGERVVGTGQFTGTEIMRIADLSNMEVRVKVNENDIVNVKLNDRVLITIDAFPGRKFEGRVQEIANSALGSISAGSSNAAAQAASVSDEITNFMVKIRITDRSVVLRPGMSATVDIETQTAENIVSVPIQCVTVRAEGGKSTEELQKEKAKESQERSGNEVELVNEREEARRNRDKLNKVIFVKEGDVVKLRSVETGIADNTYIHIKSGLKDGEEVVSGSYAAISRLLKDGMKVTVEKPKKEEEKK